MILVGVSGNNALGGSFYVDSPVTRPVGERHRRPRRWSDRPAVPHVGDASVTRHRRLLDGRLRRAWRWPWRTPTSSERSTPSARDCSPPADSPSRRCSPIRPSPPTSSPASRSSPPMSPDRRRRRVAASAWDAAATFGSAPPTVRHSPPTRTDHRLGSDTRSPFRLATPTPQVWATVGGRLRWSRRPGGRLSRRPARAARHRHRLRHAGLLRLDPTWL